MTISHPTAVVIDVIAAIAVGGWWIGAYETHVGAIVTTMAGVYYIFKFVEWIRNHNNGD